jgi:hypothetical protein
MMESFYSPSDLGFEKVKQLLIKGGSTVGESAGMFIIFSGTGRKAQTALCGKCTDGA